jgi:DNA-binding transcriptional regulator YdaS (Cro superfamily)
MTPGDLRGITISLNDEHGTAGQSTLARMLGWNYTTLWRKLNGRSQIAGSDALAIQRAVEMAGLDGSKVD